MQQRVHGMKCWNIQATISRIGPHIYHHICLKFFCNIRFRFSVNYLKLKWICELRARTVFWVPCSYYECCRHTHVLYTVSKGLLYLSRYKLCTGHAGSKLGRVIGYLNSFWWIFTVPPGRYWYDISITSSLLPVSMSQFVTYKLPTVSRYISYLRRTLWNRPQEIISASFQEDTLKYNYSK